MKKTYTKNYCQISGVDNTESKYCIKLITAQDCWNVPGIQIQLSKDNGDGFEDKIFIDVSSEDLDDLNSFLKDFKDIYLKNQPKSL